MPLDPWRDGSNHRWQPHEELWIRAADTLAFYDRMRAYRDIACMIRVGISRVENKAKGIRKAENFRARIAAE